METSGRQNTSDFVNDRQKSTVEACDVSYQSVGYDSGICLSNYRSTDGGSALLSGVLDGKATVDALQARVDDGPRVDADGSGQFSSGRLGHTTAGFTQLEGDKKDCCFFEDRFYDQDEEGDTLLHLAIIQPNVDFANRAIESTQTSDYLDIQNKMYLHTPLHLAVIMSQPSVVRTLLLSGASTTLRDRNGNTALHLACKRGDAECVRQLTMPFSEMENRYISKRGNLPHVVRPMQSNDINLMNYDGESSLHLALFSTPKIGLEIFDYLVTQCSANINAKDGKCGYTVLHQAVKSKDTELVQFLLRYPQLSINELCYSGNTALSIAISLNLRRLEMILRMAGGFGTEPSDSSDSSDDEKVDEFDDLMIGGLRLNA